MSKELIHIGLIDPNPWQPRTSEDPEHIEKIARSIAADDLMQSPVARWTGDGRAQLAFGHTRHKAFAWLRENFAAQGLPNRYEGYTVMPAEVRVLGDEAMYRQAVSENISRKDLNPIEEATAMKRAQDEFGYDSDAIGALFGKAGGTVRGMVRLLDLPERAQLGLARGEISQNAARALLSMLRVAPEQVVADAVQIIRERADRETPEIVIRGILDRQPGTVRLWDDARDGPRPHAGSADQWALDAKSFPNKHLPEMDAHKIINLLGINNDRLAQMTREHAHEPKVLAEMLKESELGTDHQRGETLSHLINPPGCSACELYTRVGGVHYCGLRGCYERKQQAWAKEAQEQRKKQLEKTAFAAEAASSGKVDGPADGVKIFEAASETSGEEDGIEDEAFETVAATAAATPAAIPVAAKPANPLLDDPYEFDQCTITVQMTMLPDDGHQDGREVMVGVRNHADQFIMGIFRLGELPMPDGINSLLDQLREQLPARELAKAMRDAEANKKK